MFVIRPATREDAQWVGENLRPEDAEEVRTVTGDDPVAGVLHSRALSMESFVVFPEHNGRPEPKPCMIYGVSPYQDDFRRWGVVWLLSTQDVTKVARWVLKESPRWLDYMSRHFTSGVFNFIDERNKLHLRWCEAAGFHCEETENINGFPFRLAYRPRRARSECGV